MTDELGKTQNSLVSMGERQLAIRSSELAKRGLDLIDSIVSDSTKEIEQRTKVTCAECASLLLLCIIRGASDIVPELRGCPDYDSCKRVFNRKYIEHLDDSKINNIDLSVYTENLKSRDCTLGDLEPLAATCVNDDWAIFANAAKGLQRLVIQFKGANWFLCMMVESSIQDIKYRRAANREWYQKLFLYRIRQSDRLHKGELILTMDGIGYAERIRL